MGVQYIVGKRAGAEGKTLGGGIIDKEHLTHKGSSEEKNHREGRGRTPNTVGEWGRQVTTPDCGYAPGKKRTQGKQFSGKPHRRKKDLPAPSHENRQELEGGKSKRSQRKKRKYSISQAN